VLNPGRPVIFIDTDMLPALEERDQKIVNNPIEAHIIAEDHCLLQTSNPSGLN
ncbi:DNA replication ATP-dependent helicase/nuclease DNA2-like, partial [Trifolium medium]|nr:DNA replication ATP-dependent helicase/nuclease DNA2-like [Trifolium medium]